MKSYGAINIEESFEASLAAPVIQRPARSNRAYYVALSFIVAATTIFAVSVNTNAMKSITMAFQQGLTNGGSGDLLMGSGADSAVVSADKSVEQPGMESSSLTSTATSGSTSTSSGSSSTATSGSASTSSGSSSFVSFTVNRVGYDYVDTKNEISSYKHLEAYDFIVEPYAAMQISVSGYTSTQSDIYYKFKVCLDGSQTKCQEGKNSVVPSVEGSPVMVKCTAGETFSIKVAQVDVSTGTATKTTTKSGYCSYVRREIRALSEDDLSATMDALYTMYSVSTSDGQELYGEDYYDSSHLLQFHHFNSAWQEADHIHEGNGFLLQHIKMTNLVEKSLQAINPALSLPYWDFTVDQANGKSSINSDVMTSDIFGSMKGPADMTWGFTYGADSVTNGAIVDGRFAGLKAEMNTVYPELLAGYGYMRAPWNMNPSPYISRFAMDYQIGTNLPSCQEHYNMLSYTDMMDYFYDIQYGPHATTHSLTGGIYGCDLMKPLLEAGYASDESSLKMICSQWIFYLKEFYRYNFITPKTGCTVSDDVDSSTCGFTCNADSTYDIIFSLKNKISGQVPANMDTEGWTAWKDFICTGDGGKIFSGDHLESASPADPSFWVIHPTLERLTHAKLMVGGFISEKWESDKVNDKVCDKASCYISDYGDQDYYDECCYGHYEFDQVLDYVSGNKTNFIGSSNADIFKATDPRYATYSMTYVYDSFTWDHCSDLKSLDFTGLLSNIKDKATVRQ